MPPCNPHAGVARLPSLTPTWTRELRRTQVLPPFYHFSLQRSLLQCTDGTPTRKRISVIFGSYCNMATFHPFPRLPYELRMQIWEMTVEPRVVNVELTRQKPIRQAFYLTSSTPVPAVLQSCREARNHGLYRKAFSEVAVPGHGSQ